MAERRRQRGVNDKPDNFSVEERRRQWNVNLANRALETLFDEIKVVDGVTVGVTKRKRIVYTADTLFEMANEYFHNIVESNENGITIIPDIEDFCMFAKISRTTFLGYRKSEDPNMAEVANAIANAIANCKKQNAFGNNLNPTIFAIDFNNNHDYVQAKTEISVSQTVSMQQIEGNIADIANRLPMDED